MKDEVIFTRAEVVWMLSILVKYYFHNPDFRNLARFLTAKLTPAGIRSGAYVA